jgi:hypothetical protein
MRYTVPCLVLAGAFWIWAQQQTPLPAPPAPKATVVAPSAKASSDLPAFRLQMTAEIQRLVEQEVRNAQINADGKLQQALMQVRAESRQEIEALRREVQSLQQAVWNLQSRVRD